MLGSGIRHASDARGAAWIREIDTLRMQTGEDEGGERLGLDADEHAGRSRRGTRRLRYKVRGLV